MDSFLGNYQVPKLNQDQINHLNSPITPKEIEAVIKSLPIRNPPECTRDLGGERLSGLKGRDL